MKKAIAFTILLTSIFATTQAQKADTVTVELARTSKVILTMQDRSDLEQLKHYDFEALFDDILSKLAAGDTLMEVIIDTSMVKMNESPIDKDDEDLDDDEDEDWDEENGVGD